MDSHSSPSTIRLTLHHAKTDPFGCGTAIFLSKTGHAYLCPVQAQLGYLLRRPELSSGPLLIHEDGQPLTRDQFVRLLTMPLVYAVLTGKATQGIVLELELQQQQLKQASPNTSLRLWDGWNLKPTRHTLGHHPQFLQLSPRLWPGIRPDSELSHTHSHHPTPPFSLCHVLFKS